jgi:hypothetical protein
MKGIELEIFYNTDATEAAELLNLAIPLRDHETRLVTFYRIDAISTHIDLDDVEQREYCRLFTGGEDFTCVLPYSEVKYMLDNL